MSDFNILTKWLGLASFIVIGGVIANSGDCVLAQIIPDNTLGTESSNVTPNVNIDGLPSDQINGGAVRGVNLFHSFQEFNIGEGQGVYFTNPTGTENIISRVTGGSPSNIGGKLGVSGGANLFLINPNGIIFGSNAQLDVRGSFIGSTASSLKFADGNQFNATNPQTTPLLTLNIPIGLQYGVNPAKIQVQGNGKGTRTSTDLIDTTLGLRVQPDQTLALVGGDVLLEGGTLKTAGGRIELGSVAAPSLVSLTPIDQGWTLGYSGVTSFGDIKLSQQATVDASGAGGGDVQVFGRQVSLSAGSQIENSNLGDGLGGMLKISASDSVELTGISEEGEFPSAFLTVVYPTATGDGGNLTIETGQLTIRDGGQILGITEGIGNGSSLVVKASNAVELIGTSEDGQFASSLYASVEPGATGTGGNINIDTKQFTIRDGAQVESDTFGQKSAGNLTINATDSVEVIGSVVSEAGESPSSLFSFVGPTATGDGGNLTIETGRLTIQDGGQIFAGTLGKGTAGILTVRASDVVELIGTLSTSSRLGSSLATSVEPIATGDGGNLTIKTKRLSIRDGAVISSATFGEGAAGSLIVKASDLVELIGASSDNQFPSRLTARTTDSRKAGDVAIGTRSLFVRDGAEVSVSSQGTGDAGNLEVTASSIRLDNGGKLTAVSASGEGGNIELTNQDFLLLRGNSEISTDATAGTGNGGNITIDSKLLAVLEKSNITANAIEGQGGNIQIETQGIFLSPNSSITASSERGINGVVEINRPDIEPTSGLIELPAQLVDVSNLIAQSCPTDVGPSGSRFVITGRGGLPEDPTKPLNKNTTWIDLSLISPSENQPSEPVTTPLTNSTAVPLAEATGWVIGNDGQVVLTAAVLNSNLEIPWMTPTTCHAS